MITQNVLEGVVRYPSTFIWVMTYLEMNRRAVASQKAAEGLVTIQIFSLQYR